MIQIRLATPTDAPGIAKVCTDGWRTTYKGLESDQTIEKTIEEFYNIGRIQKEITDISQGWNGWFVAVDQGEVVGAIGGGFTGEEVSEVYVLYLDPTRKREGIGTQLLAALTEDQLKRGAKKQWVSATKGNRMGIPFYEAQGFQFQEERPNYSDPENGLPALRYLREIA